MNLDQALNKAQTNFITNKYKTMDLIKEKDVNEFLDLTLTYEPLRDEVVLNMPTKQEREALNKTNSGIIITSNSDKFPVMFTHTVLATGPDVRYVKIGDRVLLRSITNGHSVITLDGKSYTQVNENAIYGKVKNENKESKNKTGGLLL